MSTSPRRRRQWKFARLLAVVLIAIFCFPATVSSYQQSARFWEKVHPLVWLTRAGFGICVVFLVCCAIAAMWPRKTRRLLRRLHVLPTYQPSDTEILTRENLARTLEGLNAMTYTPADSPPTRPARLQALMDRLKRSSDED